MNTVKFVKLTPTQLLRMRFGSHLCMMKILHTSLSAYSTDNEEYHQLLNQFAQTIEQENNYVSRVYGSSLTPEVYQADNARRRLYKVFAYHVRGYVNLPELPEYEAAKHLAGKLESFPINFRSQLRQRQGIFAALLNNLSETESRAAITALQLDKLYTQMQAYDTKVFELLEARNNEMTDLVPGASLAAREACNEACLTLFCFVEGMYRFTHDEALLNRIEACNREINRTLIEMKGRTRHTKDTLPES